MKNKLLLAAFAVMTILFACRDVSEQSTPQTGHDWYGLPAEAKTSPALKWSNHKNDNRDSVTQTENDQYMVFIITLGQMQSLWDSTRNDWKYLDIEETTTYYPVQDCNGAWVISIEEFEQTTHPDAPSWVLELENPVEYCFPEML